MADEKEEVASSPDVHFEPVIQLPEVEIKTMEEDEEELLKLRAKLYRYSSNETPAEWKERGTGDVKLLRHPTKCRVRVLMRRDRTLKVCANHYITPWMELMPNCGSERAWVWSATDYADEEPRHEMLAIRFANAENAGKFKEKFDECKTMIAKCKEQCKHDDESSTEEESDDDESSPEIKAPERKADEDVEQVSKKLRDKEVDKVGEQLEKLVVKEELKPSDGSSVVLEPKHEAGTNQLESGDAFRKTEG